MGLKVEQPTSLDELLNLASTTRAQNLSKKLQGTGAATKAIQFKLNSTMRAEVDKALIAFGAEPTARGLAKRELALMRVVRAAMEQLKD